MFRFLFVVLMGLSATTSWGAELSFGYSPAPGPGEKPWFQITSKSDVANIQVVIQAGDQSYRFNRSGVGAGAPMQFSWRRDVRVTNATAHVLAEFTDHSSEEQRVQISYSYAEPLKVNLRKARADLAAGTVTVSVTAPVSHAEIIAYGAGKVVLEQSTVPIDAGPGEIEVPWTGDPGEVVLLDVKLHTDTAWAGFTYSPWFLDIPHDDVLFATNSDVIAPDEEHKLQSTLAQLKDVLNKYGALVPVKLYIAGCTDTVGDRATNRDLSRRRARSIARWLRAHGYSRPIFYHGFGEDLPAVATGDGVESAANRRALYLVGANPPPRGLRDPRRLLVCAVGVQQIRLIHPRRNKTRCGIRTP